ncbi:hypothetical protein Pfra02_43800 [Pseudomonas fragi]|nr:hypothetical protein Pfra02_43800 [Pseudomonas fragi]
MAIARLSMKVGKAGKAGPHAAYIAREGQYAQRLERGEKLEASEAGNMPAWALHSAQKFWRAADANERSNGTTYREIEIALPRELTPDQRANLVREFVRQEVGEQHAYQWAIHTPSAADGGEQPHVHLMFSERQRDGIERDPEQYFKRYNSKTPEKGGARKGYGPHAGETLTAVERKADLKALRMRWQDMTNQHLEKAGVEARIDMRSHAERQTGLEPEAKQLPSQWRGIGRENVIEFRAARSELIGATASLRREVPDAGAEVINLQAERTRRQRSLSNGSKLSQLIEQLRADAGPTAVFAAQELRQQQTQDKQRREREAQAVREQQVATLRREQERLRIEQMSSVELRAEIERQRPEAVATLVERDPGVIDAVQQTKTLHRHSQQLRARIDASERESRAWREANSLRAKAHDAGWKNAAYLSERRDVIEQVGKQWTTAVDKVEDADYAERQARFTARDRVTQEQLPARTYIDGLEDRAEILAHQEQAQRVKAQRELHAKGEAKSLMKDLRGMAAKLTTGASGWKAGGRHLKALVDPAVKDVRKLVEGLAAVPPGEQRDTLGDILVQRLAKDPAARLRLSEQVDQVKHGPGRSCDLDNDHGISF